ncbi:uncharacterized protein [Phyllobates terribilis]|uniref:uncharacterized protein n=1 Tax=Phyllobates terribilis TaxID=111132 RepID=UPI003CCB158A
MSYNDQAVGSSEVGSGERRAYRLNHGPIETSSSFVSNSDSTIRKNILRTLECSAYLAKTAHVRDPRRIKAHSPSTYSLYAFPFVVGGSLIAVSPQFQRRAAFRLSSLTSTFSSSAASSQGGGGEDGGDSDTGSGSEVPGMGHEHRYGVDYCQNDDGSPRFSSLKKPEKEKSDEEKEKYARLLTLPTVLTLARVAAVPAFVCTFYVDSWWGPTTTTGIFIAAAITDWLDGYLARKMRLGTAFGAFLDPVADKLMVATTLVLLCSRPLEVPFYGDAPWLFSVPSIAIIGREITMSAVREWAASQQGKLSQAVAVNNLGKWKTATQMIALTILLACRDSSFGRADAVAATGVVILYVSAWLAVWSLFVYMRKIWKVLLK